MICGDVVPEIGDLYRLYLALNYIRKPIVTGAFRTDTWWTMKEMLVGGGGRRGRAGRAADRDLRRVPVAAAALERPHLPEPDRLRPRRHPGRAGVDAAGGRHRAGHAGRGRRAARGRVPERASRSASWPRPGRRSSGAARRRPSTCARAPRRWATSGTWMIDCALRAGRQAPRPADARLHGDERRQDGRRAVRAWSRRAAR